MKTAILLCVLAGTLAFPSVRGPYEGHELLRCVPRTEEQVEWLERLREETAMDLWTSPHMGEEMLIHIRPEEAELFLEQAQQQDLEVEVAVSNLQNLVAAEEESNQEVLATADANNRAVGAYVVSREIFDWMDSTAKHYSSIMNVINIGRSYHDNHLKVAKISSGGSKPAIFFNAGFHSREWIAPATVIWIINEMVTKYGSDPEITALVDKFDWYIMPLANPDGYDYSHDGDRFWRKTRSDTNLQNCKGADPNRNWDAAFGGAGTSSYACSDIYRGPRAFSEPETASMAQFLTTLKDKLRMYIDVHSYSQFWMTNYGYKKRTRPADAVEVDRVANIGAQAIQSVNGKAFKVGTPPELLYEASGGAFDWAKMELGVKYCYALELRPTGGGLWGFVVDAKEIPDSGRETLAGIAAAANAMQ